MGKCILYGQSGGVNTRDLPPQGRNLTLKGGNGKIDASFQGVAAEYLPTVAYYRLTAKAGAIPANKSDGVIVDILPGAAGNATLSATIPDLSNGRQYGVRLFVKGVHGWQTSPEARGWCAPTTGIAISTLAVGSEVKLNLGGVAYNHLVVHQGNPNQALYDASCNGAWCWINCIFALMPISNNFANSGAYTQLNTEVIEQFSPDVKSAIKHVKIPYKQGYSGSIKTLADGLDAQLFILGARELGAYYTHADNQSTAVDGSKLDYFLDGYTNDAKAKRNILYGTSNANYVTRTPSPISYKCECNVANGGNVRGDLQFTESDQIRFAFIFPLDFLLSPNPNADGSYSPLNP